MPITKRKVDVDVNASTTPSPCVSCPTGKTQLRAFLATDKKTRSQPCELLAQFDALNNELANTQRELIRKNSELERIVEEKSQLLGMAAHDLRHPISNILVFSELLLEDAESERLLTGEHREFLNAIRSSTDFMLRLLDSVFDISALESDAFRFFFELEDLQEIIKRVISLSRPLADRRQSQVLLHRGGSIPRVNLDPLKIEQVFNNLIGNAIKYSQEGAKIEVRISRQADGVLVSVRDNGPGIPPDEFANLFTPFQKTRARARSSHAGSGLGLAISKRIVERHGGQIWAESSVGIGSTFYVHLPIRNEPVDHSVSEVAARSDSGCH